VARQGGRWGTGADGRGFPSANSKQDPWRSEGGLPLAGVGEAQVGEEAASGARSASDSGDRDFNLCISSFGPIPIEIAPHRAFIVSRRFSSS
jgi:hypothetical protein